MDYDLTDIPVGYDRGREHGPEFLNLWMNEIESRLDGQRITEILDLGCGTGRFSEGLAAVVIDGKSGFIDHTGDMVIGARFDDAARFSGGLASVRLGNRLGYVDRTGRLVWLEEG